MKVTFNDPGLYAVFIGEMLGQFSDGYWENSRVHRTDWPLFKNNETFFDENSTSIPKIRYNINAFFNFCVKDAYCDDIISRVLMIYNHGELIKRVYNTEGKEKADKLIYVLCNADYYLCLDIDKYVGTIREFYEECLEMIDEFFGDKENLKREIPEVNPETIKEFKQIGKDLNNSFKHVRSFNELVF